MSTTTVPARSPLPADDAVEIRRSPWQATLHFCRRQPLGSVRHRCSC